MGSSKKNLYVVPNNIVGQWKNIFSMMYPNATLLCVDPKSFTPQKREDVLKQIRDDSFDGKLRGWLGFFDAAIIKPEPFSDENEFKVIKPAGSGGTDFQIIFEYVFHDMSDKLPASIIILTDGYAPFPQEKLAGGIPVLWLLNNEEVNPPWGKVARITV